MNKNRRNGILFIIVSVVLACISGLLLISIIGNAEQSKRDLEKQFGDQVWVIVVQCDTPARTPLTVNALVTQCPPPSSLGKAVSRLKPEYRPRKFIPSTAFMIPADNESQAVALAMVQLRDKIKGFTLIPLRTGDILTPGMFETTVVVPENGRAVAVAVDQVTSVSGYVHPGDLVDVIVSYEQTALDQKKISRTVVLFQKKLVLATSWFTNVGPSSSIATTTGLTTTILPKANTGSSGTVDFAGGTDKRETIVTLALSLEEATKLAYMQDFGKAIHLVIRRQDDTGEQQVGPVNQDTFGK